MTYRPLCRKKNNETLHKIFTTNDKKSSARQFLDFLQQEHIKGRHYHCLAHNGSNFDGYLVLKEFTEADNPPPHFRSLSILGMYYYGNVFRDTACYLTGSLDRLCKDFKIDKEQAKLGEFTLADGRVLVKYEICFYKPELDVRDFLKLDHKEPDFWEQYIKYCMHDTISLFIVWEKFQTAFHEIITTLADNDEKYARHILKKCRLLNSPTISSLNQRLLEELNREDAYGSVQKLKQFYKTKGGVDQEKYEFLLRFKRGGVSHTHQPGNRIAEGFIDSVMIKYLFEHYDLVSFNVKRALVSYTYIEGETVFGEYIGRLFKAKQKQDLLKAAKNDAYNPSMRKATKDSINSLSGKLLANPQLYFSLKYCTNSEGKGQRLNGVNYRKDKQDMKTNHWLTCGLMMYSYSKFLLYDYIRCLPLKGDSVIQIETDGIYAPFRDFAEFRHNLQNHDGPFAESMKLNGKELGNLVLEHVSDNDAIFLGKKKYCFHCEMEKEFVMRMLGVPGQTYDDDGKIVDLVTPQVYENVFNGKNQTLEYMSIRKTMENMPELTGFRQKRTVYANVLLYKTYH